MCRGVRERNVVALFFSSLTAATASAAAVTTTVSFSLFHIHETPSLFRSLTIYCHRRHHHHRRRRYLRRYGDTIPGPLRGTILLFPLLLRSTCRAREFGALGALDGGKWTTGYQSAEHLGRERKRKPRSW